MRSKVQVQVLTAMFVALTAVGTLFLSFRGTTGFYHLGDGIFYTAAMLLGPVAGAIAGGLGGALADTVGGYAVWAPWTLVIKGAAGWVIGSIAMGAAPARRLAGLLLGALITVVGYAAATTVMYDWPAAVIEIWGTTLQTLLGIGVAAVLTPLLGKTLQRTLGR
ncbi:MAG: ECF transporter S component, partial [Thermaerobacterales bacterium]